jgi:uncharacterized membrane protein YuzA (DUF378 family)
MKSTDVVFATLLVIGGLNWGLAGLFNFDLVAIILGNMSLPSTLVYIVVGLSAIYQAWQWKTIQRRWGLAAASR